MFLQDESGWLELTDWRADNGLNPLIIGDKIVKAPCPGKGGACSLDIIAGKAAIDPNPEPSSGDCPSSSLLSIQPASGERLMINPCEVVGRGGAAIDITSGALMLRTAQMQSGRAWTQPLYEKLPRQEKPARRADQ